MRKFRARSRSTSNFFFLVVLRVASVWLCASEAAKCGKANKSSRNCAGKMYFLSENLARAAELQVLGSQRISFARPLETAYSSETLYYFGCHRDD